MNLKRAFRVLMVLFLMAACGAAVFASGTSESSTKSSGPDNVTLRLNWLFYGTHGIFFLGIDKGYYKAENIDLTVRQGNGSGNAVRLVANGQDTFAYGSSVSMMKLAAQGAPVESVMSIDSTGTDAVLCRPDSGITNFKDLQGKKVMTTASASVNTFFALAAKNGGADPNKIQLVNVAQNALVPSYLKGLAPCILGGIDDKPAQIEANGGKKPIELVYSNYGVYQPGYSIVARDSTVKNNPDLVKRFVLATLKSVEAAKADPNAAVDSLLKWAGGAAVNKKQALQVLDVSLSILISPNNTNKEIGLNVAKDWSSGLELLKKYEGLTTDMKATQFYTNQFLPYNN